MSMRAIDKPPSVCGIFRNMLQAVFGFLTGLLHSIFGVFIAALFFIGAGILLFKFPFIGVLAWIVLLAAIIMLTRWNKKIQDSI